MKNEIAKLAVNYRQLAAHLQALSAIVAALPKEKVDVEKVHELIARRNFLQDRGALAADVVTAAQNHAKRILSATEPSAPPTRQ